MSARAKRLPRLWCAMQGLLPLELCVRAQRSEFAWPVEPALPALVPAYTQGDWSVVPCGIGIAVAGQPRDVCADGLV
jgi:hypothetical protein